MYMDVSTALGEGTHSDKHVTKGGRNREPLQALKSRLVMLDSKDIFKKLLNVGLWGSGLVVRPRSGRSHHEPLLAAILGGFNYVILAFFCCFLG